MALVTGSRSHQWSSSSRYNEVLGLAADPPADRAVLATHRGFLYWRLRLNTIRAAWPDKVPFT